MGCGGATDTFVVFITFTGRTIHVAGGGFFSFMRQVFANLQKRRKESFTDRIEFGATDAFATTQRAFFHGDAFKRVLVFGNYQRDEVVTAYGFEDLDDTGTLFEASEKVLHGLSAFHFKHNNGWVEIEGSWVDEGRDFDGSLFYKTVETFFGAHAGEADGLG